METKIILPFIVGLFAAFIAFWSAERKIAIENITQERAKWRDKIRELANCVNKAMIDGDSKKLSSLRNQFRLLLNPNDKNDQIIINLISLDGANEKEIQADKFSVCISYLLKHDWERAKLESKPLYRRFCFLYHEESETTDSEKIFIKLKYKLFYHPVRKS